MHTNTKIDKPAANPPKLHPRMVSISDKWKNLETAQNPESFGKDNPIPPAHTAMAHKIGEIPDVAAAPDTMAAVVVKATVVEPVAIRSTCEMTKHIIKIGI